MDAHEGYDKIGLLRLTSWATAAAVSLTVAALATLSTTGSQRVGVALAALAGGETRQGPTQLASQQADVESERRSLNEAVRLLATDRDRLHNRVVSLERNLDDITGSIKSQIASRPMPETTSLQPEPLTTTAPETLPAIVGTQPAKPADLPDWLAHAPEPWPSPSAAIEFAPAPPPAEPVPPVRVAALPAEPQPAPPAAVSRTEFGVDIGSGSNLDEVRILWNAAKTQHRRLIGKLRPIVWRREDQAGNPDYRLIIGPLANAAAAARLCATLGAADVMCSTRPYQGQNFPP
jgi:hypothetical protein